MNKRASVALLCSVIMVAVLTDSPRSASAGPNRAAPPSVPPRKKTRPAPTRYKRPAPSPRPNLASQKFDAMLLRLMGRRVVVTKTDGSVIRGFLLRVDPKQIIIGRGSTTFVRVNRGVMASVRSIGGVSRRRVRATGADDANPDGPRPGFSRVTRPSRQLLLGRISTAKVVASMGAILLVVGVAGTVAGALAVKKAKQEAEEDDIDCGSSLFSDSTPCTPPPYGKGLLTFLAALVGTTGLFMTMYGLGSWSHNTALLKRLRTRVNIDPVQKRYSVSMSYRF